MSDKSLFNFYLDDEMKLKANDKLKRLCGVQTKGQLAAMLRVMIAQFVATPDDKINPLLIDAIDAEYTYSQKLNKRSKL